MITKIVANLALTVASFAVMFGNYWFTFGIWPRNWWAFFVFGALTMGIVLLNQALQKEGK